MIIFRLNYFELTLSAVDNLLAAHTQIECPCSPHAFLGTCRSENKRNKMKKNEKEYMTSLKAVSIITKYSAGGCDDSSSESEFSDSSDSFPVTDSSDDECGDELQGNPSPLYFLYDCEGTGGSIYKDHIVEIAAVLQPLVNNVETHLAKSFHSLVNTSRRIAAPGKNNVLE